MAKIRIHEAGKKLVEEGLVEDSKTLNSDLVKILQDKGCDVTNHMSSISDEEVQIIREYYSAAKSPKPEKQKKKENAAPAQAAPQSGAPQGKPVIRDREGKSIDYRVSNDGHIFDAATGKQLPFRMGADGKLIKLSAPSNQVKKPVPSQSAPTRNDGRPMNASSNGKGNRAPMNQVFDGRSERDKRMAATATTSKTSHGSLTETLGDKIRSFESQLDPNAPAYVQKPKAPRPEPSLPVMPKESREEQTQTVENKPEPVVQAPVDAVPEAVTPEVVAPAPVKVVRENVYDKMNERAAQREAERKEAAARQPREERPLRDGQRPVRDGGRVQSDRTRPSGDGQKPYGDRQPRDGQRPYGDRQPRDGQRPYGDRQPRDGQPRDGQRPYGDRQPRDGQPRDGQRPYGDRQPRDGQRPYGDRQPRDGQRPYGDRANGERPAFNRDQRSGMGGQRPGMGGPAGFGGKDKDEDTQRRSFSRKPERPSGGSIKSELANELGKGQRAENLKDRRKDKNDRRDRDFEEDGMKAGKGGKKDPKRAGAFIKPVVKVVEKEEDEIKTIEVGEVITIKDLADKMKQPSAAIIKKLFLAGKMYNLNSEITFEEAEEIALEYEIICEKEVKVNVVEELLKEQEEAPELLKERPPVVCVMGHVDHGKTSLLDAIRKTNVTSREAGGITQHIGAYMVEINGKKITFLDTPGHEAFTSMRMRGAKSTDIAILVVAADDGVMPQTVEAINHAKAAGVSIIVAVNKIDKPGANIDRVKQELTEHELVAEDWGGDTVLVPVSAKTGEGIENLLEMVLLTADVLELKANPDRLARGIVIEAKLDKGRGPVATVLIQKGTLNVGDNVAIGAAHGKVRAMIDDKGRKLKVASPSTPVEILGLNDVPQAGEVMMAVADEKEARNIAEAYIAQSKEQLIAESKKQISLENMFSQMHEGELKNLNLIIKADVMGSVEAVKQSLLKLTNEEVAVRVIHGGVGNINESDVNLAAASDAIIIGFNVKPDNTAKDISEREKVDIKLYRVIYDAINDIELAMKGMLKPIYREKVIGHAEIRQLFKASGVGIIAGSFVLDGKIERGCSARISREGKQIWEGALASLKRFKDDVKEVNAGYECGLVFEKYSEFAELDTVEFYVMEEVPRT